MKKLRLKQERAELAARSANLQLPDKVKLFNMDMRDITSEEVADAYIDLVVADPPRDDESVYLYEEVGKLAMRVLKNGGILVVYPTVFLWFQVAESIVKIGFKTLPILDLHYSGSGTLMRQSTAMDDKHLIAFGKGDKPRIDKCGSNRIIATQRPDKSADDWEQAKEGPRYAIGRWTELDDTVLDPC
ncbi:MAG: class I SAM-dependent methyltransferase, partial [Nitrososphaera sp.]|nr:class I SAM-dependent methyltransferase [Nitrososphaera sp.]